MAIIPFKINIPSEEISRLRRKLEDTRLPQKPIVPGAAGDYGMSSTSPNLDRDTDLRTPDRSSNRMVPSSVSRVDR